MKRGASRWFHNVFILTFLYFIPSYDKTGSHPSTSLASHLMNSYVQDLYNNKQGTRLPQVWDSLHKHPPIKMSQCTLIFYFWPLPISPSQCLHHTFFFKSEVEKCNITQVGGTQILLTGDQTPNTISTILGSHQI